MNVAFIDFISETAINNESVLCAGFDPVLETFPSSLFEKFDRSILSNQEFYYKALLSIYQPALEIIKNDIACIKPNIAFFEQYGLGGLRALSTILKSAKQLSIPTILDCKRGDIGSTAQAYVNSYFTLDADLEADSITVNPFLGFDTANTFLEGAENAGKKGLFYLVKTSNPGSKDLQDLVVDGKTISQKIADWINQNQRKLSGQNNLSGLGAVVGATHPEHLLELRKLMPNSLLLIPGYGAQGGKASDLKPGYTQKYQGAIINSSRGLFNFSKDLSISEKDYFSGLKETVKNIKKDLNTF
jgi:orotidine-5'-phosphate decarboxylase